MSEYNDSHIPRRQCRSNLEESKRLAEAFCVGLGRGGCECKVEQVEPNNGGIDAIIQCPTGPVGVEFTAYLDRNERHDVEPLISRTLETVAHYLAENSLCLYACFWWRDERRRKGGGSSRRSVAPLPKEQQEFAAEVARLYVTRREALAHRDYVRIYFYSKGQAAEAERVHSADCVAVSEDYPLLSRYCTRIGIKASGCGSSLKSSPESLVLDTDHIQAVLDEKSKRLPKYREVQSRVWLVLHAEGYPSSRYLPDRLVTQACGFIREWASGQPECFDQIWLLNRALTDCPDAYQCWPG